MRPRVKVCGLRSPEDAVRCVELGASHIGIVLAQDSPRCATLDEVRAIRDAAGSLAEVVLVFRGQDPSAVLRACDATAVRTVQVHGAGAVAVLAMVAEGLRPIAVHQVPGDARRLPVLEPPPTALAPALLDGGRGGAGAAFAWGLLGDQGPDFVFVAGGITPDNVASLLRARPWGIDVCSGVERAPGVKDHDRLRALFQPMEVLS